MTTGRTRRSEDIGDVSSNTSADMAKERVQWMALAGCSVCFPPHSIGDRGAPKPTGRATPKAVVHFVGGFITGQYPRMSYGQLIERVAEDANVVVIATPFQAASVASGGSQQPSPVDVLEPIQYDSQLDASLFFDHAKLSLKLYDRFRDASAAVARLLRAPERLPEFGMGHSLGAKLVALINSLPENSVPAVSRRRRSPFGSIFMSFNNYSAGKSIPFFEQAQTVFDSLTSSTEWQQMESLVRETLLIDDSIGKRERSPNSRSAPAPGWQRWLDTTKTAMGSLSQREFTPTPIEVQDRIENDFACESNLIIKFDSDTIDESDTLAAAIMYRYPAMDAVLEFRQLRGNHLTPVTGDIRNKLWRNFAVGPNAQRNRVRRSANDVSTRMPHSLDTSSDAEMDALVATICRYILLRCRR